LTVRPRVGIVALATHDNGGVFQYTQAVIEALAGRSDFELVVFSQHDELTVGDLEFHRVRFERRSLLTQLEMATAVLVGRGLPQFVPAADRRAFDSVDFFFVPSVMPYPQLFFDKPYVVTIHDLQERHYPDFFPAVERFQRNATNRTVARRARAIICESSFVRQDLVGFLGIDAARISVVPAPPPAAVMGVPPSAEEVAEARRRHNLTHEYLLYPAQFWPHKNHLTLLGAFARVRGAHPGLKLVLTGGRQYQYERVVAEVRRLGLEPDVIFLGHLPYEELRGIFKGARALVVPTLFESISIPVYEAFALGVPVCVSNVVGLPEQAGDAAVLFDPKDPLAIAAAIERVVGDDALARTLVDRGRARLQALLREPYGDRLAAVLRGVRA
jgi:glycosyltransferase involved in cell wall biosynthesis